MKPFALFRSLCKAVLRSGVPGGQFFAELAEEGLESWRKQRTAEERREELELLARMASDEVRELITEVVGAAGGDASTEERHALAVYLEQVPQSIRDSLDSDDPTTNSFLPEFPTELSVGPSETASAKPVGTRPPTVDAISGAALTAWTGTHWSQQFSLSRPFYSVGREGAKIELPDSRVSRRHVALVQLGRHWVAINRSTKRCRVGGRAILQRTLAQSDLLRIGDSRLLFHAGIDEDSLRPLQSWGDNRLTTTSQVVGDSPLPGVRTLDSLDTGGGVRPRAARLVTPAGVQTQLLDQPLTIGSHSDCSVRLIGADIRSVHALLDWSAAGPMIWDLSHGGGLTLNHRPTLEGVLTDGMQITLDKQEFVVEVDDGRHLA